MKDFVKILFLLSIYWQGVECTRPMVYPWNSYHEEFYVPIDGDEGTTMRIMHPDEKSMPAIANDPPIIPIGPVYDVPEEFFVSIYQRELDYLNAANLWAHLKRDMPEAMKKYEYLADGFNKVLSLEAVPKFLDPTETTMKSNRTSLTMKDVKNLLKPVITNLNIETLETDLTLHADEPYIPPLMASELSVNNENGNPIPVRTTKKPKKVKKPKKPVPDTNIFDDYVKTKLHPEKVDDSNDKDVERREVKKNVNSDRNTDNEDTELLTRHSKNDDIDDYKEKNSEEEFLTNNFTKYQKNNKKTDKTEKSKKERRKLMLKKLRMKAKNNYDDMVKNLHRRQKSPNKDVFPLFSDNEDETYLRGLRKDELDQVLNYHSKRIHNLRQKEDLKMRKLGILQQTNLDVSSNPHNNISYHKKPQRKNNKKYDLESIRPINQINYTDPGSINSLEDDLEEGYDMYHVDPERNFENEYNSHNKFGSNSKLRKSYKGTTDYLSTELYDRKRHKIPYKARKEFKLKPKQKFKQVFKEDNIMEDEDDDFDNYDSVKESRIVTVIQAPNNNKLTMQNVGISNIDYLFSDQRVKTTESSARKTNPIILAKRIQNVNFTDVKNAAQIPVLLLQKLITKTTKNVTGIRNKSPENNPINKETTRLLESTDDAKVLRDELLADRHLTTTKTSTQRTFGQADIDYDYEDDDNYKNVRKIQNDDTVHDISRKEETEEKYKYLSYGYRMAERMYHNRLNRLRTFLFSMGKRVVRPTLSPPTRKFVDEESKQEQAFLDSLTDSERSAVVNEILKYRIQKHPQAIYGKLRETFKLYPHEIINYVDAIQSRLNQWMELAGSSSSQAKPTPPVYFGTKIDDDYDGNNQTWSNNKQGAEMFSEVHSQDKPNYFEDAQNIYIRHSTKTPVSTPNTNSYYNSDLEQIITQKLTVKSRKKNEKKKHRHVTRNKKGEKSSHDSRMRRYLTKNSEIPTQNIRDPPILSTITKPPIPTIIQEKQVSMKKDLAKHVIQKRYYKYPHLNHAMSRSMENDNSLYLEWPEEYEEKLKMPLAKLFNGEKDEFEGSSILNVESTTPTTSSTESNVSSPPLTKLNESSVLLKALNETSELNSILVINNNSSVRKEPTPFTEQTTTRSTVELEHAIPKCHNNTHDNISSNIRQYVRPYFKNKVQGVVTSLFSYPEDMPPHFLAERFAPTYIPQPYVISHFIPPQYFPQPFISPQNMPDQIINPYHTPNPKILPYNIPDQNIPKLAVQENIPSPLKSDISYQNIDKQTIPEGNISDESTSQRNITEWKPTHQITHETDIVNIIIPQENISQQNIIPGTIPHRAIPYLNMSEQNLSQGDIPHRNIPDSKILQQKPSHESIPQKNIPQNHFPVNTPKQHIPLQNIAQVNIQHEKMHKANMPQQTIIQNTIPPRNMRKQNAPRMNIRHKDAPQQNNHQPKTNSQQSIPQFSLPLQDISQLNIPLQSNPQTNMLTQKTQQYNIHEPNIPQEDIQFQKIIQENIPNQNNGGWKNSQIKDHQKNNRQQTIASQNVVPQTRFQQNSQQYIQEPYGQQQDTPIAYLPQDYIPQQYHSQQKFPTNILNYPSHAPNVKIEQLSVPVEPKFADVIKYDFFVGLKPTKKHVLIKVQKPSKTYEEIRLPNQVTKRPNNLISNIPKPSVQVGPNLNTNFQVPKRTIIRVQKPYNNLQRYHRKHGKNSHRSQHQGKQSHHKRQHFNKRRLIQQQVRKINRLLRRPHRPMSRYHPRGRYNPRNHHPNSRDRHHHLSKKSHKHALDESKRTANIRKILSDNDSTELVSSKKLPYDIVYPDNLKAENQEADVRNRRDETTEYSEETFDEKLTSFSPGPPYYTLKVIEDENKVRRIIPERNSSENFDDLADVYIKDEIDGPSNDEADYPEDAVQTGETDNITRAKVKYHKTKKHPKHDSGRFEDTDGLKKHKKYPTDSKINTERTDRPDDEDDMDHKQERRRKHDTDDADDTEDTENFDDVDEDDHTETKHDKRNNRGKHNKYVTDDTDDADTTDALDDTDDTDGSEDNAYTDATDYTDDIDNTDVPDDTEIYISDTETHADGLGENNDADDEDDEHDSDNTDGYDDEDDDQEVDDEYEDDAKEKDQAENKDEDYKLEDGTEDADYADSEDKYDSDDADE